jgi:uncharacterized protein (DUF1330 family)
MKTKSILRYSIIFALLFAATAVFYGYKEFNRKTKSVGEQKATFSLKQEDLLKEFSADEKAATQKFGGKVLEVNGTVKLVETDESGYTTVVLGDSASLSSIRCSIDSTQMQTAISMQPNTTIIIKGVCTGYNADELGLGADVILNRCVFVKPHF